MPHSLPRALAGALTLALLVLAGCDAGNSPAGLTDDTVTGAPLASASAVSADEVIPGQYVVVLSEAVPDAARRADLTAVVQEVRARTDSEVLHEYGTALSGFAARLSPEAVAALKADPRVAYVEPDRMARVDGSGTQTGATWGIDRVDQRNLPLNSTYSWNTSGEGVTIYIIDTGVRNTHVDFGGQATDGIDLVDGGTADDCYGHGTHVAGTAAGTTWGVAKDAAIVDVRVLDCGGSAPWSTVIAGVDWVTANHVAPAVANMSLGGSVYAPADAAVNNSINAGVSYSISAGNGYGASACTQSPASVTNAMTVGATNMSDARASFSNTGSCIDFFAPGESIKSAYKTNDTSTAILSGTSMSAPHVAGAAALYLEENPTATPQQVRDAIYDATTKGIVTNANSTNNHLLYSLFTGGSSPSITLSATGTVRPNGRWRITLTWSGAAGTNVDVYRDGAFSFATANDGNHSFTISPPASGATTVKVCETGSTTCSNEVTVDL